LPLNQEQFSTSRAVPLDDVPGLDFERDVPRFARAAIARIKQMAQDPDAAELLWIHAGGLPIDQTSVAYDELYGDDASDSAAGRAVEASDEEESPDFPPRYWRRTRSSPRELADANLRGAGWTTKSGVATQIDWRRRRDLYSGQATQWDAWINRILEAVTGLRKTATVFVAFTAGAGEHLGEHAGIEPSHDLFEEQIHVPLIVELPLDEVYSGRRRALSQSVDLPVTLLDWFNVSPPVGVTLDGQSLLPVIRDDQPLTRDAVYVGDSVHAGIRTNDYYYRQQLQPSGLEPKESIFVKPDDRWDADSSLRQYIDAADELNQKWRNFVTTIQARVK
jgi:arylsulfatase A-like enzyme